MIKRKPGCGNGSGEDAAYSSLSRAHEREIGGGRSAGVYSYENPSRREAIFHNNLPLSG